MANIKDSTVDDLSPMETVREVLSLTNLAQDWEVPRDKVLKVVPIMRKCLDIMGIPKRDRFIEVQQETALMMAVAEYILNEQGYKMKDWNATLWHQAYNMSLLIKAEERWSEEQEMWTERELFPIIQRNLRRGVIQPM